MSGLKLVAALVLACALPPAPGLASNAREPRRVAAERKYREGAYRAAASLLADLAREAPRDAELLERLAEAYFLSGERERARIAAAEASDLRVDPSAEWRKRARDRLAVGAEPEALLALTELTRLEPQDCLLWELAGRLERRVGERDRGLVALDMAARLCGGDPEMLRGHALALEEDGCAASAIAALERARVLGVADASVAAATERARHAAADGLGAVDRALRDLETRLADPAPTAARAERDQRSSAWLDALRELGRIEAAAGNEAQAAPEILLRRAECERLGHELGVDGSLERARRTLAEALAARPFWPRALLLEGALALAASPPEAQLAERAFTLAIALELAAPSSLGSEETLAPAWSGLFLARLASGHDRAALQAAERYLALRPGDRELAELRDEARARLGR